jgi:hypothetical protein
MFRQSVLVLVPFFILIYSVGVAGYAEAADPNSDPRCAGLSGAAYGMCISAIAIGCDDPAATNPGCTKIEENFTRITGETPTWTLPPCPCGTAERFIVHLQEQGGPISCTDEVDQLLSIATESYVSSVFSFYPYQGLGQKQTCGTNDTSENSVTNDEAKSCLIEVRSTIDKYGLKCEII